MGKAKLFAYMPLILEYYLIPIINLPLYAEAGIPACWFIDTMSGKIYQHLMPHDHGRLEGRTFDRSMKIPASLLKLEAEAKALIG